MSEAAYQTRLVNSILTDSKKSAGEALYRNNWLENAHRALSVSFPTVVALIGEQNFRSIAYQACAELPKTEYDWGEWAHDGLPSVVESVLIEQGLIDSMDYLIDCAKLDSALFTCQRSEDPVIDMPSLGLLDEVEPNRIYLCLADNIRFVESVYPLQAIQAFVQGATADAAETKTAIERARQSMIKQTFIIFRTQFKPECVMLTQQETQLYQHLAQGSNISVLFDAATQLNVDLSNWLGQAIASKHVVAAKLINNN